MLYKALKVVGAIKMCTIVYNKKKGETTCVYVLIPNKG